MEGYFPIAKAHSNLAAIEEERRLMYVAATRAKDHLILCYPGQEYIPVWQLADIGYRTGLSSFIQALNLRLFFRSDSRDTSSPDQEFLTTFHP